MWIASTFIAIRRARSLSHHPRSCHLSISRKLLSLSFLCFDVFVSFYIEMAICCSISEKMPHSFSRDKIPFRASSLQIIIWKSLTLPLPNHGILATPDYLFLVQVLICGGCYLRVLQL